MATAIQRKQEREHLHSMLMIYQTMGDHVKVREYLCLLEDFPKTTQKGNHVVTNVELPNVATNIESPLRPRNNNKKDNDDDDDYTQSQILVSMSFLAHSCHSVYFFSAGLIGAAIGRTNLSIAGYIPSVR